MEGTDVAGGVVAIHNVPGEGDVGAVLFGHLEVADMIVLGSCSAMKKKWLVYTELQCFLATASVEYLCAATYLSVSVIQKAALMQ